MQFLSMEDNLHNPSFLTFHELLSLSVGISENCNWSVLVGFLQNAPKLKDLIIEVCTSIITLFAQNIYLFNYYFFL